MGEVTKSLLFEGFQTGCHVVLRGRRGTLWHSNLFDNVSKVSKLEEVSHDMLVLMLPRVSSRVSGFPVASPCLWGKLQNLFFSKVFKQVVISFCVAGVALCYIPTCLIMCRNCQNWRKSRTTCSFWCSYVSHLESLVFLWPRRGFQTGCHVVLRGRRGTLWHSNLFDNVSKVSKLEKVSHEMLVLLRPRVASRAPGFPVASPCLWGKMQNLSFSKVLNQVVVSSNILEISVVIFAWQAQHFRRVALPALRSTL